MEIGMFISNNWHSRTLSNTPGGKVISNTKTSLTDYLLTEFFVVFSVLIKLHSINLAGGVFQEKQNKMFMYDIFTPLFSERKKQLLDVSGLLYEPFFAIHGC
jgi:hypothetical protein